MGSSSVRKLMLGIGAERNRKEKHGLKISKFDIWVSAIQINRLSINFA
jgi:hypothetical protein